MLGGGVVTNARVGLGGRVRAEVVKDDRQPLVLWVHRADVAQEREELAAAFARLDVPVELVGPHVVGGEHVPDAVRALEGGSSHSRRWRFPSASA